MTWHFSRLAMSIPSTSLLWYRRLTWLLALSSVVALALALLSALSYVHLGRYWSWRVGGPLAIEHGLTGYWRLKWELDPIFGYDIETSNGILYLWIPWPRIDLRIPLNWFAGGFALASLVFLITFLRNRRRLIACGACMKCGYDLTGNVSGVCPECGQRVPGTDSVRQ